MRQGLPGVHQGGRHPGRLEDGPRGLGNLLGHAEVGRARAGRCGTSSIMPWPHGSYINNKSAPLPAGDDVRPEMERFLRRLGYRLVLKELRHPAAVKPGGRLELR